MGHDVIAIIVAIFAIVMDHDVIAINVAIFAIVMDHLCHVQVKHTYILAQNI